MPRYLLLSLTAVVLLAAGCKDTANPPPTVALVDLERYTGTWHEIARIPNRFQRQCVTDTTARYTRRTDGAIDVLNRCRTADGRYHEVRGIARVVDAQSNAKLEVSFFSVLGWRPLWGDYWILELAKNYEYVLVGTPDRKYGWLLARNPILPDSTRARLTQRLRELGYDPARFEASPQQPGQPSG